MGSTMVMRTVVNPMETQTETKTLVTRTVFLMEITTLEVETEIRMDLRMWEIKMAKKMVI